MATQETKFILQIKDTNANLTGVDTSKNLKDGQLGLETDGSKRILYRTWEAGSTPGSTLGTVQEVSGGDNLGNHTATTNIQLQGNYLSNDGGSEGLQIDDDGLVIPSSHLYLGNNQELRLGETKGSPKAFLEYCSAGGKIYFESDDVPMDFNAQAGSFNVSGGSVQIEATGGEGSFYSTSLLTLQGGANAALKAPEGQASITGQCIYLSAIQGGACDDAFKLRGYNTQITLQTTGSLGGTLGDIKLESIKDIIINADCGTDGGSVNITGGCTYFPGVYLNTATNSPLQIEGGSGGDVLISANNSPMRIFTTNNGSIEIESVSTFSTSSTRGTTIASSCNSGVGISVSCDCGFISLDSNGYVDIDGRGGVTIDTNSGDITIRTSTTPGGNINLLARCGDDIIEIESAGETHVFANGELQLCSATDIKMYDLPKSAGNKYLRYNDTTNVVSCCST